MRQFALLAAGLCGDTIVSVGSGRYYNRTQLEPHLMVSVLYTDSRVISFDIHYFSSVITYSHGLVENFGERDGWYGTSRFTSEDLVSSFMMGYIRQRLSRLPPIESEFIGRALDEYERAHADKYARTGQTASE